MHTTAFQRQGELFARHWQLLTVVVIAQLCDLATFFMGIARVGIDAETNPLVRHLYETFGASGPLLLKVATLATVLPLIWFCAARYQGRILAPTLIAVGVSMIGIYGNFAHGISH